MKIPWNAKKVQIKKYFEKLGMLIVTQTCKESWFKFFFWCIVQLFSEFGTVQNITLFKKPLTLQMDGLIFFFPSDVLSFFLILSFRQLQNYFIILMPFIVFLYIIVFAFLFWSFLSFVSPGSVHFLLIAVFCSPFIDGINEWNLINQ
jgi:hypothetical protein